MIFLDFIWLFIFMVLIDSRPMLKSMNLEKPGRNIYESKTQHVINNANKLKRKLVNEEIDVAAFQKIFNGDKTTNAYGKWDKSYKHNKNISNVLKALTTEIGSLKRLYGLDYGFEPKSSEDISEIVTEDHKRNESSFSDTADIEAALNELKQRSIQMMIQQIPSATEIVTTAVTEATFDMKSILNYSERPRYKKSCENRSINSLKNDAVTFAYNLENMLQQKMKKTFSKIKHKLKSDLKKEINETKSTIKSEINKINKAKTHKTRKTVCKDNFPTATKPLAKNKNCSRYKTTKTTCTTTAPTVTDEYSNLSLYEQLLFKSGNDNKLLKHLGDSYIYNDDMEVELVGRSNSDSIEAPDLKKNTNITNDDDQLLYGADYYEGISSSSEEYSNARKITTEKQNSSMITNESSMEALSNKLSYNDYVNGYKYYLNFQKDQENENFSNMVRYQAHKHHNVDDIGKYILNKIPQLPSTRYRRFFFEQETIDDHDLSTKSDDSWFKKHFYFFIDKDPPKKFHTAETVTLKACPNKTSTMNLKTTKIIKDEKSKSKSKRAAKHSVLSRSGGVHTWKNERRDETERKLKNSKVDNRPRKSGYVNLKLIHSPHRRVGHGTKKRKSYNFMNRFKFHRNPSSKKHKRDLLYRKTRFNPFKGFKDMFKSHVVDTKTVGSKIFDYEVVTIPVRYMNFHDYPSIDEMLRQVPNITGTAREVPFVFGQNELYESKSAKDYEKYLHNVGSYNNYVSIPDTHAEALEKAFKANNLQNNYFTYPNDKDNIYDDLINVNIKTDASYVDLWNISLPTSSLSNNNIIDNIDQLAVSLPQYENDLSKRIGNMDGNYISLRSQETSGENIRSQISDYRYTNNDRHKYYHSTPNLKTSQELNHYNYLNTNQGKQKSFSNDNLSLHNVKLYKNTLTTRHLQAGISKLLNDNPLEVTSDPLPVRFVSYTKNKTKYRNPMIGNFKSGQNRISQKKKGTYYVEGNDLRNHYNLARVYTKINAQTKSVSDKFKDNGKYYNKLTYNENPNVTRICPDNRQGSGITRQYSSFVNVVTKRDKNGETRSKDNITPKIENYKTKGISKKVLNASTKLRKLGGIENNKNKHLIHPAHHGFQKGPLTKLNKIPQQHFATPLPMEANDFSRFLKERKMDVESVTAPISIYSLNNNKNTIKTRTPSPVKTIAGITDKNKMKLETYKVVVRKRAQKYSNRRKRNHETTNLDNDNYSVTESDFKQKQIDKVKRDLKEQNTFTAKDVAALEIVIDLRKNNQGYNDKEVADVTETTPFNVSPITKDKQNFLTNSIQVHIALPGNGDNRKRSADCVQVRKVFSAKLASPVDLVYQIHSFENDTIASTTSNENKLSPGVYMLVEKSNFSEHTGQLVLKPMTIIKKSDLNVREAKRTNSTTSKSLLQTNSLQATKSLSDHKSKRFAKWGSVKKFLGHDRVCKCRCKANKTMCKPCAASDSVMSELIFEFDNLAKYMQEHCTEIQTFFWMNPSGGKKLREVVNKIDRSLNDYYKRVKGKCQGRTCKMFSSQIDKRKTRRSFDKYENGYDSLVPLKNLTKLANDLQLAYNLGLFNDDVQEHAQNFLNSVNTCITQSLTKRSNLEKRKKHEQELHSVYSLDNVNVNLICQQKTTSDNKQLSTSSYSLAPFENPAINSFDYENGRYTMEEGNKHKSMRHFFKHRFHSKKNKELTNSQYKKMYRKNMYIHEQSSILPDMGKLFWHDNVYNRDNLNRRKRKLGKISKPIIKVLVKGSSNVTLTTSNTVRNNDKDSLIKNTEMLSTDTITFDKLFKNKSDITQNISIVENMNALFNLLGSHEYDFYTGKLAITSKRKKSRNKKTKVGKNKNQLTGINSGPYETMTTKFNNNDGIMNRLRNVTRHFFDNISNGTNYLSSIFKTLNSTEYNENRYGRNVTLSMKDMTTKSLDPYEITNSDVITTMTTIDSPTIIIIDDYNYSKDINAFTEKTQNVDENIQDDNMRSLLLSILNYNSKVLNNEWVKASKGKYPHSSEQITQSLFSKPVSEANDQYLTEKYSNSISGTTVTRKRCLIDKLARKFSWNGVRYSTTSKGPTNILTKVTQSKQSTKKLLDKYSKIKKNKSVTGSKLKNTREKTNEPDQVSTSSPTKSTEEIGDNKVKYTCDISTTIDHVLKAQKDMTKKQYEGYVKNIHCYRYKPVPSNFFIKHNKRRIWNNIRKKRHVCRRMQRDMKDFWQKIKSESLIDDANVDVVDGEDYEDLFDSRFLDKWALHQNDRKVKDDNEVSKFDERRGDVFESYRKGFNGIYEPIVSIRSKRHAEITDLANIFTNLPPFKPLTDEEFVMIGDKFTSDCLSAKYSRSNNSNVTWIADDRINSMSNVFINGSTITIENVQSINSGVYICYHQNVIARSVKVNVIDVPNFNVVFSPVYKIATTSCTYNDLHAVHNVSLAMEHAFCGRYCTVRIEEPMCLRDRTDNTSLLRFITVVQFDTPLRVNCSPECRRNLRCSLAILVAENAPILTTVPVTILYDEGTAEEEIKIWEPVYEKRDYFVTHTLRRYDRNEYHELASEMEPTSVHIIIICPAGFFLVPALKICSVCPRNTYSLDGENICKPCPFGEVSEPGLPCRISLNRLRRSACHWELYVFVILIVLSLSCTVIYYGIVSLIRTIIHCFKSKKEYTKKKHQKKKSRPPLPPIDFEF